jgi:glycosyltransferase involved in cell wall biosynthesis
VDSEITTGAVRVRFENIRATSSFALLKTLFPSFASVDKPHPAGFQASAPAQEMPGSISNVVHVTSWLSARGGGIPPVVWALARETGREGLPCSVAGLRDESASQNEMDTPVSCVFGRTKGPAAYGFSRELAVGVRGLVTSRSIVHSHGLWMHPGVVARQCARRAGCPLVVSPHGMLDPWALRNSPWKKRLAARCFENRNLRTASCLHALCAAEADSFRQYGLNNPIALVPNGVDPTDYENMPDRTALQWRFPALRDRRWILFLSRIHPKKGLPHLITAWSRLAVRFPDWLLMVAGPDELGHQAEMERLVAEKNLSSHVQFTGPLYGSDKLAALNGAELFVLPSFSEGFSMAVLEAAAAGLPVMLTPQCNFPELTMCGGGLEVPPDDSGCEGGLKQLLARSSVELQEMGQKGKCLVNRTYTWSHAAQKLLQVYAWLAGDAPKPTFAERV